MSTRYPLQLKMTQMQCGDPRERAVALVGVSIGPRKECDSIEAERHEGTKAQDLTAAAEETATLLWCCCHTVVGEIYISSHHRSAHSPWLFLLRLLGLVGPLLRRCQETIAGRLLPRTLANEQTARVTECSCMSGSSLADT